MSTELIINATLPETRIALLEQGEIQELHIERDSERGIVGNIYKGKVIRVLPGMQAAFVDIGLEKAAFLYVDDIFFPDMKTPLVSQPLPEMLPKPNPAVLAPESAPTAAATQPAAPGRGGRWGRGGRHGRGESGKPAAPVIPGSPEAHAQMQREYAQRMLDLEKEIEAAEQGTTVAPVTTAPEATREVQAAGVNPEELVVTPEQPQARAPEAPEAVDAGDDEEEPEAPAVYRPEPLIDAEAWASDVSEAEVGAEEPIAAGSPSENAPVEGAESGTEAPAESNIEDEMDVPRVAGVEVAPPPASALNLPKPLPAPLAVPVPPVGPVGVDEEDDEDVAEMPRRRRRREPVNIADLVKEGQEILVQVAKDPIGTKGARLTCHVSLPGRYLVFMPTVDHIGVSRRIESEAERRRLKETIGKVRPAKTGVIVRTASGKQTDRKLKADLDYLVTTWNDIQKKFNKQRTPSPVYQDLTIVLRAIRDMFTDEVDKVVVDSKREHKAIMKFVTRFIPNVKDKVELYEGDMPIFDAYGIETEISRALERKVWLKSGGYLVIDQAEALVAIDVNTGRYVGKKTLEETILKTNLEAVKEIAYQLRLRNCGGIIILDLIDMEKESNKEKVYKALEEALKKDRARPSILKISQLGLVEMTRKRTRDSVVRSLCEPCSYCEGRSFVKNKLTIAYDIMRDIEREGVVKETNAISIQCHPTVADVLLEDKRDVLEDLEHQYNKKITIRGNGAYHVEQYELGAQRDTKNLVWSSEERRQQLRQRIQERQQQLASQIRKQAEAERAEKRREQEERRKQLEAERAARKQQAIERRRQQMEMLEERRRLYSEHKAAMATKRAEALAAAGGDPNNPEAPLPEGFVFEEQPFVGPDGRTFTPEEIRALEAGAAAGGGDEGADSFEDDRLGDEGQAGPDEGGRGDRGRRRRRRGRRGRGGRGRTPNQHGGANQGSQGGGQGGQRMRSSGPPNVRPVNAGSSGAPAAGPPAEGGDTYQAPSSTHEHLGPAELAGSATSDQGFDEMGEGGAPREGGREGPRDGMARKRRRGRRGGRRRRKFGPRPAGQGPGGGDAGSLGSGRSGGGAGGFAERAMTASPSDGGGSSRGGSDDGGEH